MHQRALATVLLIQAIEETDRAGELLPLADRAQASRDTVRSLRQPPVASGAELSRDAERFLQQRAARLLTRLQSRSPAVLGVLALAGGLTWLSRAVLLLALIVGVSLSGLDGSRRINILAFPLIGLIAWNLLVYALLIVARLRRAKRRSYWISSIYERWITTGLEGQLRHFTRFNVPLTNALRRFVAQWLGVAKPMLLTRAKRLMHLAAALLAIGLVAGLYVRGIVLRYEAGWESTFLGPPSVHALLSLLYGPAAAISGLTIGSLEQINALRWTAMGGGGEAARWIHLIALTAALYIVVPRLLAAALATFGLWRFARRPPLPPALLSYARTLTMSVGDGRVVEVATVLPYAYEPRAESVEGLEALLTATLGTNLSLHVQESLRYGNEEALPARFNPGSDARPAPATVSTTTEASLKPVAAASWIVLLMSLASTPEVENHGTVIAGTRDWLQTHAELAPLLVVIDEGPFVKRLRHDAGFDERLQERRRLWRDFVKGYGMQACIVDLTGVRPGSSSEVSARDTARAALWIASERA